MAAPRSNTITDKVDDSVVQSRGRPHPGRDTECPICRDEMTDPPFDSHFVCGATYHHGCLRDWLEEHNTCPTCRGSLYYRHRRYDGPNRHRNRISEDEILARQMQDEELRGQEFPEVWFRRTVQGEGGAARTQELSRGAVRGAVPRSAEAPVREPVRAPAQEQTASQIRAQQIRTLNEAIRQNNELLGRREAEVNELNVRIRADIAAQQEQEDSDKVETMIEELEAILDTAQELSNRMRVVPNRDEAYAAQPPLFAYVDRQHIIRTFRDDLTDTVRVFREARSSRDSREQTYDRFAWLESRYRPHGQASDRTQEGGRSGASSFRRSRGRIVMEALFRIVQHSMGQELASVDERWDETAMQAARLRLNPVTEPQAARSRLEPVTNTSSHWVDSGMLGLLGICGVYLLGYGWFW